MSSILRSLAAVVIGTVICMLVITGVHYLGHQLFPLPAGMDFNDPKMVAKMASEMSIGGKLFVVLAWSMGAFCGSWTACLLKPRWRRVAVIVVGGTVVIGALLNARVIPTDAWMLALGVLLPIPLGLLAERISR